MNEEIDRIRKTFNFTNDKFIDEIHGSIRLDMSFVKDFKKLLNYIDKLQKELEQEKEKNIELAEELQIAKGGIKIANLDMVDNNYIHKDKIREALGNENIADEMILTYIETLASENNRLEDIEDRKVQIEYNKVFNKGVKSVEDKIRTKIKELEEQQAIEIEETGMSLLSVPIRILKELLGDE